MSHPFNRNTFPLLGLVALLSISLTACEVETDPPAYEDEPVQQTAESPVSESDEVIEITMREFEFEPADITIPAGQQVTLKFENVGSVTHEFMAGDTLVDGREGFQTGLFEGLDVHVRRNGEQIQEDGNSDHMAADSLNDEMADGAMPDSAAADAQHEHHGTTLYLEPGDVASMTFTLPESKTGEYTFACFESTGDTMHVHRGMRGTITVAEDSQAS